MWWRTIIMIGQNCMIRDLRQSFGKQQNKMEHRLYKKKTAAVICFTPGGLRTGKAVRTHLEKNGYETRLGVKSRYITEDPDKRVEIIQKSLSWWTESVFSITDVLVFVGATGIAVRAIAPYVADKRQDPAVLVLDEGGQFVISVSYTHLDVYKRQCKESTSAYVGSADVYLVSGWTDLYCETDL